MAIGSLTFRSAYGNVAPENVDGGVVLRGEVEWFVEGTDVEVAVLLDAIGTLAIKVSSGSASLRFGNVVGTFNVGDIGKLRVRCGKWGEEVFDALLEDLTEKLLSLPFSAAQSAGLPHDRSIADRDDVLLHAFLYARHILLSAAGDQSLVHALELVVRDPHRRFRTERARAPLAIARHVDSRTMIKIASGVGSFVRATTTLSQTPLARALGAHLPEFVDVPNVEDTFDTVENRFVLEFISTVRGLIERVERLARAKTRPSVFWVSTLRDCAAMRRALGPFERHSVWIGLGRMAHVPFESSVLQRRRGYKDILRHHLALRAAVRLPFDMNTTESLLGLKDVATLYEVWCYFAVVDAMRCVLGREPDVVDPLDVKIDEVDIGRGFRVAWNGGPSIFYNLSFSRTKGKMRVSSSLLFRPDIVVEITRYGIAELHVFDAKLRIDGAASVDDDAEDEARDPLSFKKDDIAKMHAYRDALPHVRSARVLYPGDLVREFRSLETGAGVGDAVGAIPLRPGAASADLIEVMRTLVREG